MTVTFVPNGDFLQASTQALGISLAANGRWNAGSLHTDLHDRYPVFISEYTRRGRAGTLPPGTSWLWRDSRPWLLGLVIRETPHGPIRLRFVENAMVHVHQNWEREGLRSLALPRLMEAPEWQSARDIISHYLGPLALDVVVFENVFAG